MHRTLLYGCIVLALTGCNEQHADTAKPSENLAMATLTPVKTQSVSLKQTVDFIDRLDRTLADNAKINLNHLQDVATHSRKFNALYDEAEHIYGSSDLNNQHRDCTNAAMMARQIWSGTYSQSSLSKEYNDKVNEKNRMSYLQDKQACIEGISEKG